jgi:hypothetical protein
MLSSCSSCIVTDGSLKFLSVNVPFRTKLLVDRLFIPCPITSSLGLVTRRFRDRRFLDRSWAKSNGSGLVNVDFLAFYICPCLIDHDSLAIVAIVKRSEVFLTARGRDRPEINSLFDLAAPFSVNVVCLFPFLNNSTFSVWLEIALYGSIEYLGVLEFWIQKVFAYRRDPKGTSLRKTASFHPLSRVSTTCRSNCAREHKKH